MLQGLRAAPLSCEWVRNEQQKLSALLKTLFGVADGKSALTGFGPNWTSLACEVATFGNAVGFGGSGEPEGVSRVSPFHSMSTTLCVLSSVRVAPFPSSGAPARLQGRWWQEAPAPGGQEGESPSPNLKSQGSPWLVCLGHMTNRMECSNWPAWFMAHPQYMCYRWGTMTDTYYRYGGHTPYYRYGVWEVVS